MATALQQVYESPFTPAKPNSFNDLFSTASSSDHQSMKEPFCMMNSASLQMCTEGLGFESVDGTEDSKEDATMEVTSVGHETCYKREKSCVATFPPPISSLGDAGKSSVCFKSYRRDGRFVLEEVRIPKQEYLHACREDGRLRLSFVESDDDDDDDDKNDGNDEGYDDEIDEDEDEGKKIDMIEEHIKGIS